MLCMAADHIIGTLHTTQWFMSYIQWILSNQDINGAEDYSACFHFRSLSLQERYILGVGQVSSFSGVSLERGSTVL